MCEMYEMDFGKNSKRERIDCHVNILISLYVIASEEDNLRTFVSNYMNVKWWMEIGFRPRASENLDLNSYLSAGSIINKKEEVLNR